MFFDITHCRGLHIWWRPWPHCTSSDVKFTANQHLLIFCVFHKPSLCGSPLPLTDIKHMCGVISEACVRTMASGLEKTRGQFISLRLNCKMRYPHPGKESRKMKTRFRTWSSQVTGVTRGYGQNGHEASRGVVSSGHVLHPVLGEQMFLI